MKIKKSKLQTLEYILLSSGWLLCTISILTKETVVCAIAIGVSCFNLGLMIGDKVEND